MLSACSFMTAVCITWRTSRSLGISMITVRKLVCRWVFCEIYTRQGVNHARLAVFRGEHHAGWTGVRVRANATYQPPGCLCELVC